jgi:very-short-patch-repair endonuclease
MPLWQAELDAWFRAHHGIINAQTLQHLGCSVRTIRRMVDREQLAAVQPGVYLSRQWPLGHEQLLAAACARNPAALIGFTTAASLWGLRRVEDRRIHVLVPHGASPELDGVIVHRCRRIDDVDIVERDDGIRLTSPPRTLFDSADMLGLSAARSVMEQLLHENRCTFGTIVDTYMRLGHPNRPGTRTMTEVITSRPKWRQALHSDLELRVLQEIERQQLPTVETQCPVVLADGRVIHLDFGWPKWRVGLEVDDPAWHAGIEERHRDANRDRKAAAAGWTVPRISKIDIQGKAFADAIADVSDILRLRSGRC